MPGQGYTVAGCDAHAAEQHYYCRLHKKKYSLPVVATLPAFLINILYQPTAWAKKLFTQLTLPLI